MSADRPSLFRIDVLGPLRLTSTSGEDCTPKGAKNQALVAMLALSPGMERPRRWIEDKLWSTFGPEQASANLRQALSKLRTAFGDDADILTADRSNIRLEPRRIRVDLLEEVIPSDERTELLEGLDVRDPEFEDWLRQERAQLQAMVSRATPQETRGILINCRSEDETPGRARIASDVLSNQIGESIAEQVRAWRQADPVSVGAQGAPEADVLIQSHLVDEGNGHMLFLKAVHQPSARILYSKLQRIDRLEAIYTTEEDIARTIYEAADQILGKLPHVLAKDRPETRSTALSRLAMYRMFSFEQDALREAYGLMEQAYRHDENGLYLAWSSMIRVIQMMEMSEADQGALMDEAVELYYRAMEMSGDNGLVQAIVSKVRSTAFGDTAGVLDLARTAVERNPSGAFALKSLSEAYMGIGEMEQAFQLSARATRIARSSPFKHWWDTGHCFAAIACDRHDDAIASGEAATRSAPLSRPAHRALLSLYAKRGDLAKAQDVANKMAKIEPGFTLDKMVNDPAYPVRTLRNKGLLEPIRALL
ncbi:transcriptional regulator [Sagittula sp. S175]|uniref:AfsR/SARP family transcriptional regulator n=1 Tax=Sagittula sp. S175 TaxID=3415129 RepID=UPI003C7B2851